MMNRGSIASIIAWVTIVSFSQPVYAETNTEAVNATRALISSCSISHKLKGSPQSRAEAYFDLPEIARVSLQQHKEILGSRRYEKAVASFRSLLASRVRDVSVVLGEAHLAKNQDQGKKSTSVALVVRDEKAQEDRHFSLHWHKAKNGSWKIVDVDVEGASITLDYRNQFARIVKKSGADALMEKISQQAAKQNLTK